VARLCARLLGRSEPRLLDLQVFSQARDLRQRRSRVVGRVVDGYISGNREGGGFGYFIVVNVLQLVFGMLVNAVLHDPGPIGLNDPRMEKELTRVFLATVRLD